MQNNRGNTIGQGKTLTWRMEKLKDDCSEGIDVNLMHSDTPMFNFLKKLLWMKWLSSLLQVKVQWCHDYFLGTLVII